ncbi:MAG: RidA family protein [Alphaproteobacteria bacterium]|nr:RidA family protein [Alphaproteobacteria bacterium]
MKTSRRNMMKSAAKTAAVAAGAALVAGNAQAQAQARLEKRNPTVPPPAPGAPPAPRAMYSGAVAYGNMVFLSGVGYHQPGTIEDHTKGVIADLEKTLIASGSSLQKCLKVNVYLNDLKDYDRMNAVYRSYDWGAVPPVRTTVAPAAGIPGNSLLEIDVIAYI